MHTHKQKIEIPKHKICQISENVMISLQIISKWWPAIWMSWRNIKRDRRNRILSASVSTAYFTTSNPVYRWDQPLFPTNISAVYTDTTRWEYWISKQSYSYQCLRCLGSGHKSMNTVLRCHMSGKKSMYSKRSKAVNKYGIKYILECYRGQMQQHNMNIN